MAILEIGRIVFSLAAVLGLIGALAYGARIAGVAESASGRKRRLKIVEALPLDSRRRLAIVRCDDREHLIVLNASSVSVIERAIPSPNALPPTGKAADPDAPGAEAAPADAGGAQMRAQSPVDHAVAQLRAMFARMRGPGAAEDSRKDVQRRDDNRAA